LNEVYIIEEGANLCKLQRLLNERVKALQRFVYMCLVLSFTEIAFEICEYLISRFKR